MDVRAQRAKEPITSLAGPYGHPFHPILVTVPIGAWVASLIFDIASTFVGDPNMLTKASAWLIAIGVLGALAAALLGFLDLLTIPVRTRAFRIALIHMSLNLAVTVLYAINFAIRHSRYDSMGKVDVAPFILSIIGIVFLGISGFLGGKLAYRYGVRVADEGTQHEGFSHLTTE